MMPTPPHIHDVLIVGGGLSGSTAAVLLSRQGLDVIVLEARTTPDPQPRKEWLGPSGLGLLAETCTTADQILNQPVRHCTLFSSDLTRSINPTLPNPPPYLVDYNALLGALLSRLRSTTGNSAARIMGGAEARTISTGEQYVTVKTSGGSTCSARLLLVATGARAAILQQLGWGVGSVSVPGLWTATCSCPVTNNSESARIDFVLGIGPKGGLGCRMVNDHQVTVQVCIDGPKGEAVAELGQLCRRFAGLGLLPASGAHSLQDISARWSPAGCCLELDNHVSKRTLVIGQAGGFVAAFSNERLYPAMWSAQLACKVLVEALRSRNPQDKLRQFDNLWRMNMAEHLRTPNAEPQSILPLIFSNQRMADKMLSAILLGTNF
jgi:flavin-dependent dehydrogenase